MSAFFKAWAAYSGILVRLALHPLQGSLATALFIYTMNLYDLLKKYTWEGVKDHHFQFHWKRVAGGKSIYLTSEWQQIASELIASKCFAHAIPRNTWTQGPAQILPQSCRIFELPLRVSTPRGGHTYPTTHHTSSYEGGEGREAYTISNQVNRTAAAASFPPIPNSQICRNWNIRECRITHCRYQHICITCSSNHQSSQCTQEANTMAVTSAAVCQDISSPTHLFSQSAYNLCFFGSMLPPLGFVTGRGRAGVHSPCLALTRGQGGIF